MTRYWTLVTSTAALLADHVNASVPFISVLSEWPSSGVPLFSIKNWCAVSFQTKLLNTQLSASANCYSHLGWHIIKESDFIGIAHKACPPVYRKAQMCAGGINPLTTLQHRDKLSGVQEE